MREITDSDDLFNGTSPGDTPVFLSLEEALLIARAFIVVNKFATDEAAKIMEDPNASVYLKRAANEQYQNEMEGYTKLHMQLAEIFPELRQK